MPGRFLPSKSSWLHKDTDFDRSVLACERCDCPFAALWVLPWYPPGTGLSRKGLQSQIRKRVCLQQADAHVHCGLIVQL
jgi:hypothetical protein